MPGSRLLDSILELSHSSIDVPSRINAILRVVSEGLSQDEAILLTLDGRGRLMCAYRNRESDLFKALNAYRCQVGEGLIGSVVQKRRPEFLRTKELPPRLGCLFYKGIDEIVGRYKTLSIYPVCDDSFVYGALVLASSKNVGLSTEEIVLVSIACRELAGILRYYELMLSSKRRMSELATLSEIGRILSSNVDLKEAMRRILPVISRALEAVSVSVWLGPQRPRFTHSEGEVNLPVDLSGFEEEAMKGRPVSSETEGYALFCFPLLSKDGAYGTISAVLPHEAEGGSAKREMLLSISTYLSRGVESLLLRVKLSEALAELNEVQSTLIQQEKAKGLRETMAYLAHEIRNPLAGIGGLARRLQKSCQMGEREQRYLALIVKEVERLEKTLKDVLEYVKEPRYSYEPCDLNACLDETLHMVAADPSWQRIEVVKEYGEDVPTVLCDARQIRQVFLNILVNACEAMKERGRLKVRTRRESLRNRLYAAVSFEDTGGGIDPAVIANIFNPFFTTKENGTGLGLAISEKIVRNHGGMIEIENMPGKGAVFTVYLPFKEGRP